MRNKVADFYLSNPRMVSSPFGGIDDINLPLLKRVFEALELDVADKKVLDIGCGRGYFGQWVCEEDGDYTGVDLVASRPGFRMALADAMALPFPDAAFDMVTCFDAFEHIPDPDAAAREIRRVLLPGGSFYLSAPNYTNVAGLVKWWSEFSGRYAPQTWAPFGRWQPQELEQPLTTPMLKRVFRGAGFKRFRRVAHPHEVELGLFPWIDHPRMPDAVRLRSQTIFRSIGPAVVNVIPDASLHSFWRMDV